MIEGRKSLWIAGLGAALTAAAAPAQTGNEAAPVGPPQLQNFQLQPAQEQPQRPETQGPAVPPEVAPRSSTGNTARPSGPPIVAVPPASQLPQLRLPPGAAGGNARPAPAQNGQAPARMPAAPAPAPQGAPPSAAPPQQVAPEAAPEGLPAPPGNDVAPAPGEAASEPAPISIPGEPVTPATTRMLPIWLAGIGGILLLLLGFFWWRRFSAKRRVRAEALAAAREAAEAAQAAAKPAPAPRVDPAERPWLEIDLRAERATFNQTETLVQFELDLANVGASQARNVRIDVKLFNAGAEQDQEIGAFFRTAGRESARVKLPAVEAGVKGTIRGEVSMPREEMRALRLDERLLYIPVIAVNVLYDYGEGQTGQTSKSYVVGRELQQPSEKMGAFRVDQGPRVWRAIGQRQHKLARRI